MEFLIHQAPYIIAAIICFPGVIAGLVLLAMVVWFFITVFWFKG